MKLLKYSQDRRSLTTVFLYFCATLLSWMVFDQSSLALKMGMVLAICILSFLSAVIVHNTIHVPVFISRKMNRIFQVILSFTYGHPVSAFIPGHNLSHHRYTQTSRDVIRTSKLRFKLNILNQLLFFFVLSGDILKSEINYVKKMYEKRSSFLSAYFIELFFVFGFKIALAILDWKKFLILIAIPHQFAAWGIVGTNYFQHDGCDENDKFNHSRNFVGKTFNWFLFNNGFHGAHHMRPSLHWSKLPEFHARSLRPYLHPALDRKSLFVYLFETHIYPAKRLDFRGNPVILPPKTSDEEWITAGPVVLN